MHCEIKYTDELSSCSGVNSTSGSVLPSSEMDLALRLSASLSDGGRAVDKWEATEWVAEQVENVCLTFLKGWAMAFVLLLIVVVTDAALPEMVDDLVDLVSAGLAMVRKSDYIPYWPSPICTTLEAIFNFVNIVILASVIVYYWCGGEGFVN